MLLMMKMMLTGKSLRMMAMMYVSCMKDSPTNSSSDGETGG